LAEIEKEVNLLQEGNIKTEARCMAKRRMNRLFKHFIKIVNVLRPRFFRRC